MFFFLACSVKDFQSWTSSIHSTAHPLIATGTLLGKKDAPIQVGRQLLKVLLKTSMKRFICAKYSTFNIKDIKQSMLNYVPYHVTACFVSYVSSFTISEIKTKAIKKKIDILPNVNIVRQVLQLCNRQIPV